MGKVPLWNFSSIGGTIMRTFARSSLVVADMFGESGISWYRVVEYGIKSCVNRTGLTVRKEVWIEA